jgi:hypothetical protein
MGKSPFQDILFALPTVNFQSLIPGQTMEAHLEPHSTNM